MTAKKWRPTADQLAEGPKREVIFFRNQYFYIISIFDGEPIENHVDLNPGTLRVEDAITREVLWPPKPKAVA